MYDFIITDQDDTLGNVLQSYCKELYYRFESLISFLWLQKITSFRRTITLTVGVNPQNKAVEGKTDEQKVTSIVQSLDNIIEDTIKIYDEMIKIGSRVL